MSLLPDDASFHERVQALFAHYRARGVALSAKDVELLEAWAAAEVPFEVVARGLRLAAEKALWDAPSGGGRLQSLWATKRTVEAELTKFRKASAGRTDASGALVAERKRKLLTAIKKLSSRFPTLNTRSLELESLDDAERAEHLVLARLARALPFATRLELGRRARAQVNATEAAARRLELRFHRSALVRRELDVPAFW